MKLTSLPVVSDPRGKLIALEGGKETPFAIARVYYLYDVTQSRGFHAHRTLRQLMICLRGSCRVVVDDGDVRSQHTLDSPAQGLFIGAMTWREMHDFSPDCLLMVLASDVYDESDYIRDYATFRRECRQ